VTPEQISRALEQLIGNDDRRRALAAAGHAHVTANFDIRKTTKDCDDICEHLITQGVGVKSSQIT
jgi:hypothetical protein